MANATTGSATSSATIRAAEAEHFGALAADWWNPAGSSAMLHRLNPVRLGFIRDALDEHWGGDAPAARPLMGKRALDVGCGAGLLCEPLARLGADVTGIDAAAENIAAAAAHAEGAGLRIDYRHGDVAEIFPKAPLSFRGGVGGGVCPHTPPGDDRPHPNPSPEPQASGAQREGLFNLVTAMEVIEHVADKPAFIAALAAALAPGGLMILSTPNRTPMSRLLLVEGAERIGMIPRGTHHWADFITPDELRELLADAGLTMGTPRGIAWSPPKGLHLSDDLALNYIVTVAGR